MLFAPERHEPLTAVAWDAGRAREAIESIVRETQRERLAGWQWPLHPLDDDGDSPRTGFKALYLGAAGVLWALWYLKQQGAVELDCDPAEGIRQVDAAYRADPDTGQVVPSYYLGEVGILLVLWRLTGSRAAADRLHTAVQSNIANPTNEALWAAPGTMLAAWHLWLATGEARWRSLFLDNVEQLWRTWDFDEQANCHLWTQDLYGDRVQYLGAAHGFAGNVYPLLKGAALLDEDRRAALHERCVATLRATARREGDEVNWPAGLWRSQGGAPMLMQWCHGAPGIVTALADFPPLQSAELDALLVGAGHAIWRAGPLAKGQGLCHGTAGNGYALLKLYQRTADATWLDRARALAMHAIAQRERMRGRYGRGRYTLWTGDPGLAIYLWHCLAGSAALPVLDVLH